MGGYKIPVKWGMKGYIETPCVSLRDAVEYALSEDADLPGNREFIENSLQLNIGQLYRDARTFFPDSDAETFQKLLDHAVTPKIERIETDNSRTLIEAKGIDEAFDDIIKIYLKEDLCIEELMSSIEVNGLSLEDVFELVVRLYKNIEGDTLIRIIGEYYVV